MATKNAVEVKSLADLEKELASLREELREARYAHTAGELVNPRVLGQHRKAIARLLTEINNKQEYKEVK